jgi:dTDP-4-dehydrorhamnose reductase
VPDPAIIAPVVLLGADGMLGRAFRGLLTAHSIDHAPRTFLDGDLTDPATAHRLIGPGTRTVINCTAWTDVDAAEAREHEARRVNADALAHLAAASHAAGATLVHFSTDYVFNGSATAPYTTDHPRAPLGAYGRTKAAGEAALEASRADWLCLRTSWLYAPWAKNFVRTIAALAATRPELKVVADQRGRPTSAEHLARVTLALLASGARGMHHATDSGECTWHEFAREIVRLTRASCTVHPCTTADFPRPAPRPAYSVLDISRTEAILGPLPDWRLNLADVLRRIPLSPT